MGFQIFFTIVCLAAAITTTAIIVIKNREFDGKTPLGWWIVGTGISQFCIVIMLTAWCKTWLVANQWIIYLSGGILIAVVALGAVAKFYGRRHWYKFLQKFTPPVFRRSFSFKIILDQTGFSSLISSSFCEIFFSDTNRFWSNFYKFI